MAIFGRGGILTNSLVDRARTDVLGEFHRAGIATGALENVRVDLGWVCLDDAYGYYEPDGPGVILLSRVTLARRGEYLGRSPWTSVRDVLRHEYAHALVHHHPACVAAPVFPRVFGALVDAPGPVGPWHPDLHATPYAATSAGEDFAETVMVYLRGAPPVRQGATVLRRKLGYVAGIGARAPARRGRRTGQGSRHAQVVSVGGTLG